MFKLHIKQNVLLQSQNALKNQINNLMKGLIDKVRLALIFIIITYELILNLILVCMMIFTNFTSESPVIHCRVEWRFSFGNFFMIAVFS